MTQREREITMRWRGFFGAFGLLAAVVLLVGGVASAAVELGAEAPPLKLAHWVKGSPVTLAEGKGKNLYVVEFWATWCPPCKESIPHLSALQKRYASKGVVIIGISDEPVEKVRPFVEKNGRMNYRVACDDRRQTSLAYRKPYSGIPRAFVVDRNGKVVWTGSPLWGLERALELALAGKLDPKTAATQDGLREQFFAAVQRRDLATCIKSLDRLIATDAEDPDNYTQKAFLMEALGKHDDADKIREHMRTTFSDNPRVLVELARHYATAEDLSRRSPAKAVQLAARAVELTAGEDLNALTALARAYYSACQIDKAVEAQQRAVALAAGDDKTSAEAALDFYRSVKKLQKTGTASPPAEPVTTSPACGGS